MMHQLTIEKPAFALRAAQDLVTQHHYLHKPVDVRSRPFAYLITGNWTYSILGCLIVGRPEATRCYDGALTYGSQTDVQAGRAQYDRWEVLNLARVWLHPGIQTGGVWCTPERVPGFTDRRGVWRPAVASWAIASLLERVGFDYLKAQPPVWVDQPYQIRALLSYCDTRIHRGTIYRAAGWELARRNKDGIETWYTPDVPVLTSYQDDMIRKLARDSERSRRMRQKAHERAEQQQMSV